MAEKIKTQHIKVGEIDTGVSFQFEGSDWTVEYANPKPKSTTMILKSGDMKIDCTVIKVIGGVEIWTTTRVTAGHTVILCQREYRVRANQPITANAYLKIQTLSTEVKLFAF